MNYRLLWLLWAAPALLLQNCQPSTSATGELTIVSDTLLNTVVNHPEWSRNASIYQINIRQYSPQGTISAVTRDLDRIEDLGVKILWIMPIQPVGELNREGTKGNYYSLSNYRVMNPEMGNIAELQRFVGNAHDRGMKVILDWQARYTSADHNWISEHPNWYKCDSLGVPKPLTAKRPDASALDFDVDSMQMQMIDEMRFWIQRADIDGFRCADAARIPLAFWERVRKDLASEKAVFMLAEAEQEVHHKKAFDMSYSSQFYELMNGIASENIGLDSIDGFMRNEFEQFPLDAYRMLFLTNHSENAWRGHVTERFGEAQKVFAALAFTIHGMPLVYAGQEGGLNKRLSFFEKDTIQWTNDELEEFYGRLIRAKQENRALHNGSSGGKYHRLLTAERDKVFAFVREKGDNKVVVVLNFSEEAQSLSLVNAPTGSFENIFDESALSIYTEGEVQLEPYGYYVFTQN